MFHSDIWSIILSFINLSNRLRMKCVCHKFNELIHESYSYRNNTFKVNRHLNYDDFTKILDQNRLLVFRYDNVIEYDMCFIPNVVEFCPILNYNFVLFEAFKVEARSHTVPAILITIKDMDMGLQRTRFIEYLETLEWKCAIICILYKFRKENDPFEFVVFSNVRDHSDSDDHDDHDDFVDVPVYGEDFALTS